MPPKKNKLSNAVKPTRNRKIKSNVETMKNFKIMINNDDVNVNKKDETRRRGNKNVATLSRDIRIALANEVVNAHFKKKVLIPNLVDNKPKILIDPPKKKRVYRKKKIESDANPVVAKKVKLEMENDPEHSVTDSTNKKHDVKEETGKPAVKRKKIPVEKQLIMKNQKANNQRIVVNKNKITAKKRTTKNIISRTDDKFIDSSNNLQLNIENVSCTETVDVNLSPHIGGTKNDLGTRRNSLGSSSDLSWTKDISSGSTTSCVTVSSNDIIRIDKKMPIVKLTNINQTIVKGDKNTNVNLDNKNLQEDVNVDSDKFTDTVLNDNNEHTEIIDNLKRFPLNLSSSYSTSSNSSTCQSDNIENVSNYVNDNRKNMDYLSKLSSNLKRIDLEVIVWTGYSFHNDNDKVKLEKFKEKITKSDVLREERKLLQACQNIQSLLNKYKKHDSINVDREKENSEKQDKDASFVEPIGSVNHNKNRNIKKSLKNNETAKHTENETDMGNNITKSMEENDDDDALSLYAESITGLDSCKKNNSIQCGSEKIEEYVPEFVSDEIPKLSEKVSYCPTKINDCETPQQECNAILNSVCEKQNADSTSASKEHCDNMVQEDLFFEDRLGDVEVINRNESKIRPIKLNGNLMADNFETIPNVKSFVYRGACFFNFKLNCKNQVCKFSHTFPEIEEVKNKIVMLNNDLFVAEYMLTRSVPALRRRFTLCFVNECAKRKLTRILVEMAIDSIINENDRIREDTVLKTAVVEQTLLYLNVIDLNLYVADLLKYKINKETMLCDVFLEVIAKSLNVTRFIPVFINIVWFMSNMNFTFDVNVAAQLLERVCILPYDDKLARAFVELIKKTNDSIFSNKMIENFEDLLRTAKSFLYEQFVFLKRRKRLNQLIGGNTMNVNHIERDTRYSPDTTNYDNLNNFSKVTFTRTIQQNRSQFPNTNTSMGSNSSSGGEKMNGRPYRRLYCGKGGPRMPFKRRLDQSSPFGGYPSKIPRMSGHRF